ncbi:hypothetical protein ACFL5O_11795 [Myxococcota bacterium]
MTTPVSTQAGSAATHGQDAGAQEAQETCGSVGVQATIETHETVIETPGNALFVFDQSTSMGDDWNGKPKWQAANDAVVAAFEPLQDKLNSGAVLFPTGASDAAALSCDPNDLAGCLMALVELCPDVSPISSPPQLPIQSGPSFLSAWNVYWTQGAGALRGGTPTEKALLQGEAALATPPPGTTVLVLVTDGEPTCGSNESAVAARLLEKGIKTHVVGLPGSRGARVLDQVAIAGGTAPPNCTSNCFLTPADGTELRESLASIATTTVTTTTVVSIDDCTFELSPPQDANANPDDVHLVVTEAASGQQYEVQRSPGTGWTLSADQTTATLEPAVCDAAKAGKFSSFDFRYGCVSVPELPDVVY